MELKYLLALWNTISKYVINGHGDPTSNKVLKFYANGVSYLKTAFVESSLPRVLL